MNICEYIFIIKFIACRKFDTKNCTSHNGTMLYNGTCIFRDCFFSNGSNIIEQDLNPATINSMTNNVTCNIEDSVWNVLRTQNSKMASDEYFQ